MATTTESNPKLAKLLIPTGHWRFVTDAEHGPAIAALAKVVGAREAKFPSLQRRLAVRADGSEFLLTFNDCLHRDPNNISWDVGSPPTQSFPTALPIAEAVELLNSEASPEKELARRVALADARTAKENERRRIESEKLRAESAAHARAEQERADFRADSWAKLSPLQQSLARLALAVAERDPKFAEAIRAAADADPSDFPRAQWWAGMPRFLEAQRVDAVLATIPSETRTLLKIQHGPLPAAIVKGWELLQEQRGKARP